MGTTIHKAVVIWILCLLHRIHHKNMCFIVFVKYYADSGFFLTVIFNLFQSSFSKKNIHVMHMTRIWNGSFESPACFPC